MKATLRAALQIHLSGHPARSLRIHPRHLCMFTFPFFVTGESSVRGARQRVDCFCLQVQHRNRIRMVRPVDFMGVGQSRGCMCGRPLGGRWCLPKKQRLWNLPIMVPGKAQWRCLTPHDPGYFSPFCYQYRSLTAVFSTKQRL